MHRNLPLLLALVLLGCAQPETAMDPGPDPELGLAPIVVESDPSPVASPAAAAPAPTPSSTPESPSSDESAAPNGDTGASPQPSSPAADAAPTQPEPSPSPGSQTEDAPEREPVVLLAVADPAGDHGSRGPDWADLRSVELVEIGNDLRVTLRLGGEMPPTPPEGEVPLLGVDIGDEGYQLFVEGGGQSWAAYLDTPEGFVEYPGTFELAGSAMVLQVPFSAVGSPTRAQVRAFVEWSRDSGVVGVLNPASEDHLDDEPHTFDRAS